MSNRLQFDISAQPDDTTCGPTCLQAVYKFYGDSVDLHRLVKEIPQFDEGGTLAVHLGCHALRRGYKVRIYTYKLNIFDPTWFDGNQQKANLREKLQKQSRTKRRDPKFLHASRAYIEFLDLGGKIFFEDLNPQLIRKYLKRSTPILTGLSATYLYRYPREIGHSNKADDLRGEPVGHFVVICGFDKESKQVLVADPYQSNPYSSDLIYSVNLDRAICSILLGVVTYDGILLIIEPGKKERKMRKSKKRKGRS